MSARKLAWAFAGQGAEQALGRTDLFDDEAVAFASETTGVDLARAFERRSRELRRTSVLQPALVALGLAAWRRADAAGVDAALACGHSVGEITAWAASGAVDERDAIRFAAARGAAMDRAAEASPGGMLAIAREDAPRALEIAGVALAARNGPSQVVVSGSAEALGAVARACAARRVDVAGPWHSRAMGAAADETRAALEGVPRRVARIPVVTCLDGRVLDRSEAPDFVAQLTAPVAWDAVLVSLAREGVTDVVCAAPGRVNRGLLRDGLGRAIRLHVVDATVDVARLREGLARA